MTRSTSLCTALTGAALLAALVPFSCKSSAPAVGEFKVLTSNVSDGDTWALNRPITLFFNNEVAADSVGFGSVVIRPTEGTTKPVTGTFELIADARGRANHGILFRPACPTNEQQDNGGLVPGSKGYELVLPTQGTGGTALLRDTSGHQLSVGLTRSFRTPALSDPLFADTAPGPPDFDEVVFPESLGLYSQEAEPIVVRIDQPVNGSPTNLSTERLYVQYANSGGLFPPSGNLVPGSWLLVENCNEGALLHFNLSGVLIPGRAVRVVMTSRFEDLGGNVNNSSVASDPVTAPTLDEIYGGPPFDADDVTYDEYTDSFEGTRGLDLDGDIDQPLPVIEPGRLTAAFGFPGEAVAEDDDFTVTAGQGFLEIDTTGTSNVADGLGNVYSVEEGVLSVDDFTIEAGAVLRVIGENPFVLYATGDVTILGTLDASGFDADRPDGGTLHPEIVVPGAEGGPAGGAGGDASQITDDFTPRAEAGDGAFGEPFAGGGGGEGGFQQWNTVITDVDYLIAGGGAGGSFATGRTDAVFWGQWGVDENPATFDNAGPDLREDRHTIFAGTLDPDAYFTGGEAGLRGSAKDVGTPGDAPHGVHGYEDFQEDSDVGADHDDNWDPPETGTEIEFDFGNPTFGPDGGTPGSSPFVDGDPGNDFWGQRYYWDGQAGTLPRLVTGELSAPWAGSGGGGSGDMQTIVRLNTDGMPGLEPLTDFFPDPDFPFGTTAGYWRGAGGGGGGGQVQIMAIGTLVFGETTVLSCNGGAGNSGESTDESAGNGTITQISGSGGGSGGHMVLHSATGLNLEAIDVGTAGNPTIPSTFFDNVTPVHVLQAIGGRRGWAASRQPSLNPGSPDNLSGAPNGYDGNSSFMAGRGGAGASGVIQIHVPDPTRDILFHPNVNAEFKQYIRDNDLANPVVSDRLDEVLGVYAMPQPFGLVPLFSPRSMVLSEWVDTGLADQRNPANGTGPFPDYDDAVLSFLGVDEDGVVQTSGNFVAPGSPVAADGAGATAVFDAFQVTINGPSAAFGAHLLQNPNLLLGYDVVPNAGAAQPSAFEVVDASYQAAPERLVLTTRVSDGPMNLVATGDWEVREKFFRVSTTDVKDRLPASASVQIQFQGTEETAPGSNVPDEQNATEWTGVSGTSLADLQGMRFFRFRIVFDLDALNTGVGLDNERPAVDYVKTPFAW